MDLTQEELSSLRIDRPISPFQEQVVNDHSNTVVIVGGSAGSSKTHAINLRVMLGGLYDPDFTAAVFRKTRDDLFVQGGLWHELVKMSQHYGTRDSYQAAQIRFPALEGEPSVRAGLRSNAQVIGRGIEDREDSLQGAQSTLYAVDEAGQMKSEKEVVYLLSRLRSKSKQKSQILLTCNPETESFLFEWLKQLHLDEDGAPIPDMAGVTTFFTRDPDGEMKFFKTREEIEELYGEDEARDATSLVFYPGTCLDNPWLMKNVPEYVSNLKKQSKVNVSRLLHGHWIGAQEAGYLKREWFNEIDRADVPVSGIRLVRGADLAGTKKDPNSRYEPDWTRLVKVGHWKDPETNEDHYYILDMKSVQDRSAVVYQLVKTTAKDDGRDVLQVIPQDSGSAGKWVADQLRAQLVSQGNKCDIDSTRGSKMKRAESFLIAAQERRVHVVKGVFNDQHWKEVEAFNGGKSSNIYKDDIVDAIASSVNALKSNTLPAVKMPKKALRRKRVYGSTPLSNYRFQYL